MAQDILGQEIKVGSMVLWSAFEDGAGFKREVPLEVIRVGAARASLRIPGQRKTSAAPFRSLVVVDRILEILPQPVPAFAGLAQG